MNNYHYEVKCTDGTWQAVNDFQAAAYRAAGAEVRKIFHADAQKT